MQKKWNEWQVFAGVGVLVIAIVLIAVLAQGLGTYENTVSQAERQAANQEAIIPQDPDGVAAALSNEEVLSSDEMEAELQAETAILDQDVKDTNEMTKSYE